MSALSKAALFIPLFGALLALSACFQRRRAQRHGGWNYLTPGPFYWFGLVCGIVVSAVATVAAGGRVPTPVAAFFVLMTLALAVQTITERVRWNGKRIERRTVFMQQRQMAWNELSRAGVEWTGYHWISSFDGPPIRFSSYDNGFDQLMAKIARHLPDGSPPAETVPKAAPVLALAKSR
ncbi:MAG: hypothetical protein EOP23_02485 [Hyphomicrobiales bacterium]|nr:MAG: hypothetical protein EOP23_02485 [Hyphomicrobiales bacterium]